MEQDIYISNHIHIIYIHQLITLSYHIQVDLSVSGMEKLVGARQALSLFQVRFSICIFLSLILPETY